MVEVNPPEFQGANCYTFEDFRQVFGGVVCEEGVVSATDLLVTAAGGASVNVNVAAGSAWVAGDLNGSSGMYFVTNDASVSVTIAANGAGSSRIDRIIASVYDSQYIGAADNWAIEVVQGTAGAGVPAVPDSTRSGWVELGQVTVPASGGTPSTVSDTRQGVVLCDFRPFVDLRASGSTSVPHNTATKIVLATTNHIDSAFFTVASSVVTIVQDGWYDIGAQAHYATSTVDTTMQFFFGKNGTSSGGLGKIVAGPVTDLAASINSHQYFLPAGTTVQLIGYQFQYTGALAVATVHDANDISRLMIRKVG